MTHFRNRPLHPSFFFTGYCEEANIQIRLLIYNKV